jgi:hypothetical protein
MRSPSISTRSTTTRRVSRGSRRTLTLACSKPMNSLVLLRPDRVPAGSCSLSRGNMDNSTGPSMRRVR